MLYEVITLFEQAEKFFSQGQPDAGCNLIVSRAPGMHPAAYIFSDHIDEPGFKGDMDVFVAEVELFHSFFPDFQKPAEDFAAVLRIYNALFFQHYCVSKVHCYVSTKNPPVGLV